MTRAAKGLLPAASESTGRVLGQSGRGDVNICSREMLTYVPGMVPDGSEHTYAYIYMYTYCVYIYIYMIQYMCIYIYTYVYISIGILYMYI